MQPFPLFALALVATSSAALVGACSSDDADPNTDTDAAVEQPTVDAATTGDAQVVRDAAADAAALPACFDEPAIRVRVGTAPTEGQGKCTSAQLDEFIETCNATPTTPEAGTSPACLAFFSANADCGRCITPEGAPDFAGEAGIPKGALLYFYVNGPDAAPESGADINGCILALAYDASQAKCEKQMSDWSDCALTACQTACKTQKEIDDCFESPETGAYCDALVGYEKACDDAPSAETIDKARCGIDSSDVDVQVRAVADVLCGPPVGGTPDGGASDGG